MAGADRPMGEVTREGERWVLRYERELRHAPEKVWRAITESEHLRNWLPCDLVGERREGAALELPFWPEHLDAYAESHGIEQEVLRGEIRRWEPPRLFEWTWDTDVLRWELHATGTGTRLVLTTWVAGGPDVAAGVAAGYHVCLDELHDVLDHGKEGPIDGSAAERWESRYAELVPGG